MQNVILVKDIGVVSALSCMDSRAKHLYGVDYVGASANFSTNSDKAAIHLSDTADSSDADTLLADIEKPTCTTSGLDITTNIGQLIVNDSDSIIADGSLTKFVKVSIGIDDTTGDLEVFILERTTGIYGSLPSGKTFVTDLKEFSVIANGTTLTLVEDRIT